jgi:hypothetical protein
MPGITKRARSLRALYRARKRILIEENDSDTDAVDEAMEENLEFTATIQSQRYLLRPSKYRNKNFDADKYFHEWINDSRYVVFTHMTRSSFEFVHAMIKDDIVFVNPNPRSTSQQRSVYFQLFIALSRFASNGDGWCFDKVCESFEVGHGTILLYTERVCTALGRHEKKWVSWPNALQRRELSALGDAKYGFPGFIASCDGTLIALRRAPAFDQYPETYHHHRHGGYGFNVLFWVDHHGSIIRFTCNWPASASDQTIFDSTAFACNPWVHLTKQNEEYIFVDLGFKREVFAVPPYKGKEAKEEHNAMFNHAQRRGRVKVVVFVLFLFRRITHTQVEHANGVIKARFASLKGMPIDIRSNADHLRCAAWITACVVLHNILIVLRDEFEYEEPVPVDVDDGIEVQAAPQGKAFQDAVRDRWLMDVQRWERV